MLFAKYSVFAKAKQRLEKLVKYVVFAKAEQRLEKLVKYVPFEGEKRGNALFVVKKHRKIQWFSRKPSRGSKSS